MEGEALGLLERGEALRLIFSKDVHGGNITTEYNVVNLATVVILRRVSIGL